MSSFEDCGCDVYPIPSQVIVVRPDSSSWTANFAPVICSATQIAVLDDYKLDRFELDTKISMRSLSMESKG